MYERAQVLSSAHLLKIVGVVPGRTPRDVLTSGITDARTSSASRFDNIKVTFSTMFPSQFFH